MKQRHQQQQNQKPNHKSEFGCWVWLQEDMGKGSMHCTDRPYKNNTSGGICAFCHQEKLGKLVSFSFPIAVFPSSSSSSSPSLRSDFGTDRSSTFTLPVCPTQLSTSNTRSLGNTSPASDQHHSRFGLVHYYSLVIRYHVPRSWFKTSGNILVVFEEKGGDPTQIRFSNRKLSRVCAHVSEDQPSFGLESSYKGANENYQNNVTVQLKCPSGTRISAVYFASFGTPTGSCGSFSKGECHDPNSISSVEK
ncbi:hypothetical protein RJ639_034699, partial [Escallonia herrerae]